MNQGTMITTEVYSWGLRFLLHVPYLGWAWEELAGRGAGSRKWRASPEVNETPHVFWNSLSLPRTLYKLGSPSESSAKVWAKLPSNGSEERCLQQSKYFLICLAFTILFSDCFCCICHSVSFPCCSGPDKCLLGGSLTYYAWSEDGSTESGKPETVSSNEGHELKSNTRSGRGRLCSPVVLAKPSRIKWNFTVCVCLCGFFFQGDEGIGLHPAVKLRA